MRRIAQREQADAVRFRGSVADEVLVIREPPIETAGCTVFAVSNVSRRRILNVECGVEASRGAGLGVSADMIGTLDTEADISSKRVVLRSVLEGARIPVIRPGGQGGFLVPFDFRPQPLAPHAVRFTDDAGLHWQIDQDVHLRQLNNRDDW